MACINLVCSSLFSRTVVLSGLFCILCHCALEFFTYLIYPLRILRVECLVLLVSCLEAMARRLEAIASRLDCY